jgi:ANTAR domain/PAS fold
MAITSIPDPAEVAGPKGAVGSFDYHARAREWSWSPELYDMHGLPVDTEPSADLLLAHVAPEQRGEIAARFQKAFTTVGPFTFSYRLVGADGRARQVTCVGDTLADEATGAGDLRCVVVDISEPVREHAREAVEAAAEHRAAIEQAKGALIVSFGVDEDTAFMLLRSYSMRHNVKLSRLAERIMECLLYPAYADLGPAHSLLAVLTALDYDPENFPRPRVTEQAEGEMTA